MRFPTLVNPRFRVAVSSAVLALACGLCPALAQQSATTALRLTVNPQCTVAVLSDAPAADDPSARLLTFRYLIRTGKTAGSGAIALQLGVPSGSRVDYQTRMDGPGVPASGSTTTTPSGVVVARFGPQSSSTRAGAVGTVRYSAAAPVTGASLSIGCQ